MPNYTEARQVAGPGVFGTENQEVEYEFEANDQGIKELQEDTYTVLRWIGIPEELTVGSEVEVILVGEPVGAVEDTAPRPHGAAGADDYRDRGIWDWICRARRRKVTCRKRK